MTSINIWFVTILIIEQIYLSVHCVGDRRAGGVEQGDLYDVHFVEYVMCI